MKWAVIFIAAWLTATDTSALPNVIPIGALFDSDPVHEIAYRYSMEQLNSMRNILPRSLMTSSPERIPPRESFMASKKVCQWVPMGVAAIFGPNSEATSDHVLSMCQAMKIPHIETHWKSHNQSADFSVNLYPDSSSLSRAYWDVISSYKWKTFTLLYDDEEGLIRLQDLMLVSTMPGYKVVFRSLLQNDDYRPLLKEMKRNGERNIILDCSLTRINTLFTQALQVGMMTMAQSYFITSLDMNTINFEPFKYLGTNITGLRMIDPTQSETINTVGDWVYGELRFGRNLDLTENTLTLETALIYDGVQLLAKALHELDRNQEISLKRLTCDGFDSWNYGSNVVKYMKMIEINGLTGRIKFDENGLRSQFNLQVIEMQAEGLVPVGTWNSLDGANFTRQHPGSDSQSDSLFNKTLVVSSILSDPYFMLKETNETLTGNDRFEGFCKDIIHEISEMLGFRYVFKLVDDGNYGNPNPITGEFDGMVRELLDGKADLALGDLSINSEREAAVDFTMPFLNTGISILYKKPTKKVPNLFSFLSPLSVEVWIYMCTAYLAVSLTMFTISRITPDEWQNPHPCRQMPDILENQFTILNSTWFAIGSLMQQGSDIMPRATSTRMVAALWWFFTLIMISSYTANLAAFLTVERMDSPITNVEDLAKQTKIKYGCLGSGSSRSFFRRSTIPLYQRMNAFMSTTRPSVFTKSNMEGVERVQRANGAYAFMMEATSIEFFIERKCDVMKIGGMLDSKGYGIAMRPGLPFQAVLSQAVLKLQESNTILKLKTKWWKRERGGGVCKDESKSSSSSVELGIANVGGIFVVLIGGTVIAFFLALCEFVWKTRKLALDDENKSIWKSMMEELKTTMQSTDTKPARPTRLTSSQSIDRTISNI